MYGTRIARFNQDEGVTDSERDEIWKRIDPKAPPENMSF